MEKKKKWKKNEKNKKKFFILHITGCKIKP